MNFLEKLIEKIYLNIKDNLVYYDGLTRVNNRMYLDMVVKQKYDKKSCYVIFVDIDNLKDINDNNGHEAGDKRIITVANELKEVSNVKELCRIGGDEFIIICDTKFNPNLLDLIEDVSCGYYLKSENETVSHAMKIADEIMYATKQRKKIIKSK